MHLGAFTRHHHQFHRWDMCMHPGTNLHLLSLLQVKYLACISYCHSLPLSESPVKYEKMQWISAKCEIFWFHLGTNTHFHHQFHIWNAKCASRQHPHFHYQFYMLNIIGCVKTTDIASFDWITLYFFKLVTKCHLHWLFPVLLNILHTCWVMA